MFEKKKQFHNQPQKTNPSGNDQSLDLSLPEMEEEKEEEVVETKKKEVSVFKNVFGSSSQKQEPSKGSCGCFS